MAATTANLLYDNSTVANFVSWGEAISNFIGTTAGWSKAADTGQVDWSTISAVPGSGSYVYEIWEPNDSLTNFFLKIEYGNGTTPSIRVSLAQTTNGAGQLVGNTLGPFFPVAGDSNAPNPTTQYVCKLSGQPGRLSFMLWLGLQGISGVLVVERSLNASGAYTGDYVTLATITGATNNSQCCNVQSLHFTYGVAPASVLVGDNTGEGLPCRIPRPSTNVSANFNGSIPLDLVAPFIGYWDFPMTSLGGGPSANYTVGATVTTTVYGQTRTYVGSNFVNAFPGQDGSAGAPGMVLVRWD